MTIGDVPHNGGRKVTWNTKATVSGYGTDPEPYLILRIDQKGMESQRIYMPMAIRAAIAEWPLRSTVNLTITMDNTP